MIHIKNVTKKINQQSIFENLTLQLSGKTALFGPNGCGKTTLCNMIAGIDKTFHGNIHISGDVSYMLQNARTLLPWYTCYKNIMLPREYYKRDKQKGKELLQQLQQNLTINFPLSKYPFMLSGGQKQLVMFLRSLMCEPDIIILDEPFAALDTKRREQIKRILENIQKTILIISHRGDEVCSVIDTACVFDKKNSLTILREKDYATRKDFENEIAKIDYTTT